MVGVLESSLGTRFPLEEIRCGAALAWGRGSAVSSQRVAAPYPPNASCLGLCGTQVGEWGRGGGVAPVSPTVF